jgi:sterol desaturase/sphingolipid hydroxylase (fatty acid hydroxylase superfamily)
MTALARRLASVSGIFDRLVASNINYHAVLILDLVGAAGFLAFGLSAPMPALIRAAAVFAGFAAWGFIEYALHRWLGHGPRSVGRRGHALHHADDTAPVAAPVFVVMAGVWAIWAALSPVVGSGMAALIAGGIYAGYNHYALVHHLLHHYEELATQLGLARIRGCHRLHHRYHDVNFGVTSTIWDRILGTYRPEILSKTSRS